MVTSCSSKLNKIETIKFIEPIYPTLQNVEYNATLKPSYPVGMVMHENNVTMSKNDLLEMKNRMDECRKAHAILMKIYYFYYGQVERYETMRINSLKSENIK